MPPPVPVLSVGGEEAVVADHHRAAGAVVDAAAADGGAIVGEGAVVGDRHRAAALVVDAASGRRRAPLLPEKVLLVTVSVPPLPLKMPPPPPRILPLATVRFWTVKLTLSVHGEDAHAVPAADRDQHSRHQWWCRRQLSWCW